MATHRVWLQVSLEIRDAEGVAEESANIAATIVEECLSEDLVGSVKVHIMDYEGGE